MDVTSIIEHCKKTHQPCERDASFDYCFNYFQEFREGQRVTQLADPQHIQVSCLQIAFFLASWGMLRGSSFLFHKSIKFYEPLIRGIAGFDERIWAIDVDSYSDDRLKLLFDCQKMIVSALGPYRPSDLLVTKIMLGIFGNVPAFDVNFCKWLGAVGFSQQFNQKSLRQIAGFYQRWKVDIDAVTEFTLDFATGQPTHRKYTKALIIDMIGFTEGAKAS